MSIKLQRATRTLFTDILKKGKVYHSPHLSFRVYKISPKEAPAFSFVVSKKVARLAVSRNVLKRRGRSVIQKIKERIQNHCVGAFFFKKGAEKLSFKELEEEVVFLLSKSNIL